MCDLTEIFDALENVFENSADAGSGLESITIEQVADSLSYAGIDIAELPPEQASEVVTAIEKQITFGGTEYFEGMQGRIDRSMDGGFTWETIS